MEWSTYVLYNYVFGGQPRRNYWTDWVDFLHTEMLNPVSIFTQFQDRAPYRNVTTQ